MMMQSGFIGTAILRLKIWDLSMRIADDINVHYGGREMDNSDVLRIAMQQQAIDLSCTQEDFYLNENKVVISKENPKARSYLKLPVYCNLASFGNNVVASVNADISEVVLDYINKYPIEECFAVPNIFFLNDELQKHGWKISFCAQRFLPDMNLIKPIPCNYELKILQPDDYAHLYGVPGLGNALGSGRRKHLDKIAIGAYDGKTLIGLAGSSADCDTMWQFGIDVLPNYRRKGIAAALTSRLAVEILHLGIVQYTGNRWANIRSLKTELAIGFRPAWVDMLASPIDTTSK